MRCRAVVLSVPGRQSAWSLRFNIRCHTQAKGSPCTGECLEAQEWQSGTHLLVVGTEDAETLGARMPYLGLGEFEQIVRYANDSMEIQLATIPSRREVTLHFIIAENTYPEPGPDSAWFAVDIPHRDLPTA